MAEQSDCSAILSSILDIYIHISRWRYVSFEIKAIGVEYFEIEE
jgi:hypothetical protein